MPDEPPMAFPVKFVYPAAVTMSIGERHLFDPACVKVDGSFLGYVDPFSKPALHLTGPDAADPTGWHGIILERVEYGFRAYTGCLPEGYQWEVEPKPNTGGDRPWILIVEVCEGNGP